MALVTVYRNEFNDDPGEYLSTYSGNGDWDFTGGELRYRTKGQDCNWWYTTSPYRNGVLAYKYINDFGIVWPSGYYMRYFETKITYVNTPTNSHGTYCFQNGSDNRASYWISFTGSNLYAYYVNGGTFTTIASTAITTTGLKIRFLWDRFNQNMYWQYDSTGAGAWTSLGSLTSLPFWPDRIGWYCKNWSTFPSAEVRFDYAEFGYDDAWIEYTNAGEEPDRHTVAIEDDDNYPVQGGPSGHTFPREIADAQRLPGVIDPRGPDPIYSNSEHYGPRSTTSFSDRYTLPFAGGPPNHNPELGTTNGIRLPSNVYNTEARHLNNRQQPTGSYNDTHNFLTDGGTDVHVFPSNGRGLRLPGPSAEGATSQTQVWTRPTGSFNDDYKIHTNRAVDYNTSTLDSEGHNHLAGIIVIWGFFYNTAGEDWANPTTTGFSGYGRDGTLYTNGVQDPGPVYAPWATEAASNYRSSRSDFPEKVYIAVGYTDLVIYDASTLNADGTGKLDMWMRFMIGPDNSTYYLMARAVGQGKLRTAEMHNGVLFVGMNEQTDRGGVQIVDFRQTGQSFHLLVRSDDVWWGTAGRNITHRNQTGNFTTTGAPTFTGANENVYSVSVKKDWGNRHYVFASGEDNHTIIAVDKTTNVGLWKAEATAWGDVNVGDIRNNFVDNSGWLWYATSNRLVRNMYDAIQDVWSHGDAVEMKNIQFRLGDVREKYVNLPHDINEITQAHNYLYVATTGGVYKVHRGTLEYYLCYTVVGGGGRGKDNVEGAGELIKGDVEIIRNVKVFYANTDMGDSIAHLQIATNYGNGSATIIRLTDDYVSSVSYDEGLDEHTCYYNETVLI